MPHGRAFGDSEYTAPTPVDLFRTWLRDAQGLRPSARSMSLATATTDGRPSLRTVMLQAYGAAGFVFFTETRTEKARQLALNPRASLLFFWPESDRQIRIDGDARRLSIASLAWSRVAPLAATDHLTWISSEGLVADSREALAALTTGVCAFIVEPSRVRFWQGGADRRHAVVEYARELQAWSRTISGPPELRQTMGLDAGA